MTIIGYARVSTTDQDLTLQLAALKAAGCEIIRREKASARSTKGRTELDTVLDFLRKGDDWWLRGSTGWPARWVIFKTSSGH